MKEIEIEARCMSFQALADGPEDGPLLLLLHGLPRNRWEWHHQIPAMAEMGFRVVAPDCIQEPALQAEPETFTRILLEHLSEHAR